MSNEPLEVKLISPSLHDQIMRLSCDPKKYDDDPRARFAFKEGHRDARHAAAELAAGHEADAQQAAPVAVPPAQQPVDVPDECPHMIVFDDADRKPLMFAGAGSREAAMRTWEQISAQWNAHLFVRVARNCCDDRYPSATLTAPGDTAAPAPAPEQAEQPHPVNRSVIRDVFLRNGFTIKEGHSDLKPYVYAAAEELLALDGRAVEAEQAEQAEQPDSGRELISRLVAGLEWALPELNMEPFEWGSGEASDAHQAAIDAIAEARALIGGAA